MTEEHREKINAVAEALYNLKPVVEQEEDTLDGSPASPPFTVPWEEIRKNYPATYEAIIGMALVCANYIERAADLPLNTTIGQLAPEEVEDGLKVCKFELISWTGEVEGRPYEVDGPEGPKWHVDVIWDDSGCMGSGPLAELALVWEE